MRGKRVILLCLLSAALLLVETATVFASTEGTEDGVQVTTQGLETDQETIRVAVWAMDSNPIDASNNALTQWIQEQAKEQLGIRVEFVKLLWSNPIAALEEMLDDGTAPDIFFVGQENFLRYAEQGLLADLTDAYEEYGDQIRALGDFQYMGELNGRRYALMSRREADQTCAFSYIRKDWLEALDLEVPTTKEELIEYLYAVKEQNPGEIGDVVPWAMSGNPGRGTEYLGFVGSYVSLESERDVYLYSGEYMAIAPGALEGIRQLNTLYNDGLLSADLITDSKFAGNRSELQIKREKAGFFSNQMSGAWSLIMEMNDRNGQEETLFVPVQCFETPEGGYRIVFAPEYESGEFGFVCVPAASQEKVDACVRYLNWMADPEVAENILYAPEHIRDEYGVPIWLIPEECDELGYPWPTHQQTYSLMTRHLPYQDDPDTMISYWKMYTGIVKYVDDSWLRWHWDMMQEWQFRFPSLPVIPAMEIEYGRTVEKEIIQYVYQLICCTPEEFDSLQEMLYRELEEAGLSAILEGRAECYDLWGQEE